MQNLDATFDTNFTTIDLNALNEIIGGAGWGETIGSWVGGAAGAVAGGLGGAAVAGPVGGALGGYAGGRAGEAGGAWLGRQVDNYFGGGQ